MIKKLRYVLVALLCVCSVAPCVAQLRVGPKVGICANKLKFDQDILNTDNRVGLTAGMMAEFTVPVIGVGVDASLLYVHRSAKYMEAVTNAEKTIGRDYIDVPVNLKWKIGIPAVGNVFCPFITTGPDFAFLCSKKAIDNAFHGRTFDFAWNFGLGFQLVNHLQVAASYGLGLSKAVETLSSVTAANIPGKNRYWTVTATYLF